MNIPETVTSASAVGILVYIILKEIFAFMKARRNNHNPDKTSWQINEMYQKDSETRKVIHDIASAMATQTRILERMEHSLSELVRK